MGDRETGQIKWFNPRKGYGFIAQEDREDEKIVLTDRKSVV